MEEGASSSNWSNDRTRLLHTHYNSQYPYCNNCVQQTGVGRTPQNIPRSQGPLTLGRAQAEGSRLLRNNLHSVMNELGPLMHHARTAETHGLNLRSWLRRSQSSGHRNNVQSNSAGPSDSTIIDFDNFNDPSTSHSQINTQQPIRINQPFQVASQSSVNVDDNIQNSFPEYVNFVNEQQGSNIVPNVTIGPSSVNNNASNNINDSSNNNNSTPGNNILGTTENENAQTEPISPETLSVLSFFQKYIPFVIILLGKAIYDHRAGILIFLGLLVTFTHADSVVKREIAKQSRRSLTSLLILFVNLFVCICFIYYVFQDQKLYKSLIFIPPYSQPLSLWDLLWIVGITDFVLKFITIQIKAGMACFPARLLPYSARGKWYLLLECISQLYRGLAPIQPWLYYLLESYQGPEKVIGVFLSAAYMVSKGTDLMSKVKLFKQAVWKLVQNVSLGVSPSKEQLDTAGSQCPICHDDYETPVLLHCRHVFCEACVTTWFDREQTCPLCRAKIADDPAWRDGATTFFAQLF